MRIRMLRDAKGSPDGTNLYHYEADHVYAASEPHAVTGAYDSSPLPLSNRLATLFVAEGWAIDEDARQAAATAGAGASNAAALVLTLAPVPTPEPAPEASAAKK